MIKTLLFSLTLLTQFAVAQDVPRDMDFVETQNTMAWPFNIPLYIDLEGNLNIITKGLSTSMSFMPNAQVAFKKSQSHYIKPIPSESFALIDQKDGLEWTQVKRRRWELGLGLSAAISAVPINIGLTPFKGSRQVMTRTVLHDKQLTPEPSLPLKLEELKSWKVGDLGTFQTYGGIQISAGIKYAVINAISVGLTIQNLFNVVVTKTALNKVRLSISEESLNKRRIQSGAVVAVGTLNYFNGKRLTTHFYFDLTDPSHSALYELAIKGQLTDLQKNLPPDAQNMEWKGSEKIGYIGIPVVAGKHFTRSKYDMDFEGKHEFLDVRTKRSAGLLVPLRNHNKLVYQTDDSLTLFWYSEMLNTHKDIFTLKFLNPGIAMGARGFNTIQIPEGMNMGATHSQIGISFTRKEIESVTPELLESILVNFKERCENLELSCAGEKRYKKIAKTLRGFLPRKWEDLRDKLGFIMIDEPALVHSYIKSINAKKIMFFKFLNQKYQSLEGTAVIEI